MGLDVFDNIRARRPGDDSDWFEQSFIANLGDVIRSVGVLTAREGLPPVDGTSPARDWDALIAQVRSVAQDTRQGGGQGRRPASQQDTGQALQPRSGEIEMGLRQREMQAQNLLRSAHRRLDEAAARMTEADEKVRAAEDRARAAEARAAAMIEAAERRAAQAEEAARSALDWLQRLRQAAPAPFAAQPAPFPAQPARGPAEPQGVASRLFRRVA
ncbi:hypothetical protein FF100_02115 [Methylobacterium terricola]|uniref:Uncharacterized protein n=1 Tax=Methylobacterium terricola TaxID=2583531 RepID=A0A5C4LPH8_9HYPH|nr:hypothetical protein [Methylobacterium terricola]TNC16083.1 hypothetical protein FF100_02115 [Methylobacterium terricola]